MSNKYRARRQKMQSPAVCKKSLPGPIRLRPDQAGYPFTGLLYATLQLPSGDPRNFPAQLQLLQLKAISNSGYQWTYPRDADGIAQSMLIDFGPDPANPTIHTDWEHYPLGQNQRWDGHAVTASYLTFSTRLTPLAAGLPIPSTEPAIVQIWR